MLEVVYYHFNVTLALLRPLLTDDYVGRIIMLTLDNIL